MKTFLFISFLMLSLFTGSCNSAPEETPEQQDSLSEVEKDARNQKLMTEVSTEHLFRFFSSNYHLTGNLPCMYYDAATDEFVISGKKLFTRIKAEEQKAALESFHEFLCIRGYSPDGDSAIDEFQKVKVDGKDMYYVQMSDLLPEMTPEEIAFFTPEQLTALKQTSNSVAYHYLGHDRNYPLMYASSLGITIECKNLQREVKMENAKEAFDAYGKYIDSIRKK
jgi:hypothetical protein